MADELALRRELDALARKRAALDAPGGPRRGNGGSAASGGPVGSKKSVFARLGAGNGSNDSPRGAARTVSKENSFDDNQQRGGGGGSKRSNSDRFAAASKRQRLHSAVSKPTDGRAEDPEDVSERKKRAVAPFTQKDTMARSRRMFGALMGHLGKAKAQIERDSDLFKRQDSKQHEAEKKEKIQSKTLEDKAKRDVAVQKLEKLIARSEVDSAEQLARLKLEHLQKTRKSASLAGYLQTVASPPIFYLPAKHTKETEDLVAASKEAHEEKLQISVREHETRLRELDAEFAGKLEKLREQLEEAKRDEEEKTKKETNEATESALVVKEDAAEEEETADSAEQVSAGDGEIVMADDGEKTENKDMATEGNEEQAGDVEDATLGAMDDDGGDAVTVHSLSESRPESNGASGVQESEATPMKAEISVSTPEDEEIGASETKKEEEGSKANLKNVAHDSEQTTAASKAGAVADEEIGVKPETPGAPSKKEDEVVSEEPTLESSEPEAALVPETPKIAVSALKVTELREELKKRGLDTKGLKASLVARLEQALAQDAA